MNFLDCCGTFFQWEVGRILTLALAGSLYSRGALGTGTGTILMDVNPRPF